MAKSPKSETEAERSARLERESHPEGVKQPDPNIPGAGPDDPRDGESDAEYKARMLRERPAQPNPPETEGQRQAREAAQVPPVHPKDE